MSRRLRWRDSRKLDRRVDDYVPTLCHASLESVSSATSATTPLRIDVDRIVEVLLADGWHKVKPGSFTIAPYSFVTYRSVRARRRRESDTVHDPTLTGILGLSYMFREFEDERIVCSGPLAALGSVRYEES